jgi:hypothetical protein
MSKTDEVLRKLDRVLALLDQLTEDGPPTSTTPDSRHIAITLDRLLAEQRRMERLIMALTANEQAAVNDLSTAINTIATDLGGILTAGAAATAQIAALIAQGSLDAAAIASLTAIQTSMETDVVGALAPLTTQVVAMHAGLTSPATPDAPLSAE